MVIIWKYNVTKKAARKNSFVPNYVMQFRIAVINVRVIVIDAFPLRFICLANNNVLKFWFVSTNASVSVDNRVIIVTLNARINAAMRFARRNVEIFVIHVMVNVNINVYIKNVRVNVFSNVIENHVRKGVVKNWNVDVSAWDCVVRSARIFVMIQLMIQISSRLRYYLAMRKSKTRYFISLSVQVIMYLKRVVWISISKTWVRILKGMVGSWNFWNAQNANRLYR